MEAAIHLHFTGLVGLELHFPFPATSTVEMKRSFKPAGLLSLLTRLTVLRLRYRASFRSGIIFFHRSNFDSLIPDPSESCVSIDRTYLR